MGNISRVMLRQLKERLSPEKLGILRATAQGLAVDLECELVRIDQRRRYDSTFDRLYNAVYLPTAIALADDLPGVTELEILRSPMAADLINTQLRITLGLLYRLIAALSSI